MQIEFKGAGGTDGSADTAIAVLVFEEGQLSRDAKTLDTAIGGAVSRALSGRFRGEKGETLALVAPAGLEANSLLLVGAGPREALGALEIETAAASAFKALKTTGVTRIEFRLTEMDAEWGAHAAFGARLAAYRFDKYLTREDERKKSSIETFSIISGDAAASNAAFASLSALADGIAFARDLTSEPANSLYPEEFARRMKALERFGLEVEILDEAAMEALGMGALLGVGQGSARKSQLVVAKWNGSADPEALPVAFVGKGVCFDAGGISIKPAPYMEKMKSDMGGAGVVAGAMQVLAMRKARINAIGILGLVENMPDGGAQRPGDIVTSMSGQTIEVINTDAEGRLVLADALWYCQDRFKPRFMVDLATLTGTIIMSLGRSYAGLFSNDDELADALLSAGADVGEKLWRMPIATEEKSDLDTLAADMRNRGYGPAGAIEGALFIERFVNGMPWAHLDIAGVVWKSPSTAPMIPEGATGWGVRLLDRLVVGYED